MASDIKLTGWHGLPGQYKLAFRCRNNRYFYETWDKALLDDIRECAAFKPGRAFNMAKNYCRYLGKESLTATGNDILDTTKCAPHNMTQEQKEAGRAMNSCARRMYQPELI